MARPAAQLAAARVGARSAAVFTVRVGNDGEVAAGVRVGAVRARATRR